MQISKLLESLDVFEDIFESVRIIDPVSKQVLRYADRKLCEDNTHCFDIWERSMICENCISLRAYEENKPFVKVEYSREKIYIVTATPLQVEGKKLVIELLKDATDSLFLGTGDFEIESDLKKVIDNLNAMAMKDSLTGLLNRRYVSEKLPVEIVGAYTGKRNFTVILADIDHFKIVNDTYGHSGGDEVLKTVAKILIDSVKTKKARVVRYGGEEFLVVLRDIALEEAKEIAETMRQELEKTKIAFDNKTIQVTASFGISTLDLNHNCSSGEIIDRADSKLYLAKAKGRNRIEW